MPKIIEKSISILSDAGLGMAMFSLGQFHLVSSRIILVLFYIFWNAIIIPIISLYHSPMFSSIKILFCPVF